MDFHPYTQLVRAICRSATVRSSTHLSTGFNLARHRSSGFRSSTIDSKRAHFVPHSKLLRTCRFPFGYVDQPLNLANDQDSLGHFSKRKTGRCSYLRFHALSACAHLVSGSFHIPLRILFSFHSRYSSTIGLELYVGLEVSASHIHARYPTHTTPVSLRDHIRYGYGTLTLYGCAIPDDFSFSDLGKKRTKHHMSPRFPKEIRFVLFRFRSPLLTESRLISFPPPTEMLQFRGFPIANAIGPWGPGSPIQRSTDPRHSCTSPRLFAACHDLRRHSSRAIPQMGCSIVVLLRTTSTLRCPGLPIVGLHRNQPPRGTGLLSRFPSHIIV